MDDPRPFQLAISLTGRIGLVGLLASRKRFALPVSVWLVAPAEYPLQFTIELDADSMQNLLKLLTTAIENGTAQCSQSLVESVKKLPPGGRDNAARTC